ncbi:refilin-B-like [Bombina bombina]|uniref:refilin-B n=1 Tax=Bombina bombina TaxID=8345 RepID=UPI00235ABC6A|nr:refilin-B [Bombina bombina]XP_053565276.1 refilin-B-like [Bombina bombina]
MVGRLNLQDVPDLLDMKKKGERVLDSPDSGLPPSPCPSNWLLTAGVAEKAIEQEPSPAQGNLPLLSLTNNCIPRLCPLSFGEGVEFDPLPPKEIRYTSSVKYDSDKHFIDNIYMPVGLGLSSCRQTVICVPNCTWRNYKAEVYFEPKNKPQRFMSTTIVYPKHTKTVYTTTLDFNCKKFMRRFLSSVELEAADCLGGECYMD